MAVSEAGSVDVVPGGERHDLLDKTFNLSLLLKGFDGALELIGGVLLLVVSPAQINHWAERLTQHELSKDPHDFIANHLLHFTGHLHSTQLFAALYLLTHGLVKLVIVVGLYRREHWSYYVAFVFLGGFVIYQIYRLTWDHSVFLLALTLFDIFIIWMTIVEFRRMRADKRAFDLASTG